MKHAIGVADGGGMRRRTVTGSSRGAAADEAADGAERRAVRDVAADRPPEKESSQ
ncbi:MAG: hypothetical protein OXH75_01435 [Acidobacteria bacterium]|nr:hypothetical protein [Acidobacteriota bacterium]